MLTEERYGKIMVLLEKYGSVTLQQLMKECNASESTIRRDLSALAANNQLTKVYGGAILQDLTYYMKDDEVEHRKEQNPKEKLEIGRYAAGLIEAGDFVYIDAGTTTECMIDFISCKQVTFITNSISHAKKLSRRGYQVHILGGEFKDSTEAIVGIEAVASLEKYNFTKGFFGTNGISRERGYSTPEIKEAMVKSMAMEHTKECYVLADESKFNQISSITFASFDKATILTTKLKSDTYIDCENILEVLDCNTEGKGNGA